MHRLGGGGAGLGWEGMMGMTSGPKGRVTKNAVAGGRVTGGPSLGFILRPHGLA